MMILLVSRILQVLLTVFQIRLATMLLGPSGYGLWVLLLTVVSFCVLFGVSPFGLYLNRHINDWNKQGFMPEIFRGYSLYLLGATVCGFIFFFLIQQFNFLATGAIVSSSLMMALLFFSQTFNQTWLSVLNLFGDRMQYVVSSVLSIFSGIVFILLFYFLGVNSPVVWGFGVSLGLLLVTFFYVPKAWFNFRTARFQVLVSGFKFKDVFSFSGPLFLSTIFLWFQTQGYRLLIEEKIGLQAFGKFAACQAVVVGLFTALDQVVSAFYQPNFFRNISEGSPVKVELSKIWDITFYPFLLAASFLFFTARDLSLIFLDPAFTKDNDWIAWMALAEGLRVIFTLMTMNFHGTKRTSAVILPHLLGVLLLFSLIWFNGPISFVNLSLYLAAAYLLTVVFLLFIDFQNFYHSHFVKKFVIALAPTILFTGIGYLISLQVSGLLRIACMCILGCIFMAPYYLKQVRGKT